MEGELPILMKYPAVCIITDANSDLGKEFSLGFARKLHEDSILVLMASSVDLLDNVKKNLIVKAGKKAELLVTVKYDQKAVTMPYAEHIYGNVLQPRLEEIIGDREFPTSILIHNAGAIIGYPTHMRHRIDEPEEVRNYLDTNLIGLIAFNNMCMNKLFAKTKNRFVINTTWLSGFQPYDMPLYCAGKEARDMFFKVLSAEHRGVRVLNMIPGPYGIHLPKDICEGLNDFEVITSMLRATKEKGVLVRNGDSVPELIEILCGDKFGSYEQIYFFY